LIFGALKVNNYISLPSTIGVPGPFEPGNCKPIL